MAKRFSVPLRALGLVIAVSVPALPAAAQTPGSVRVNRAAPILRWFRPPVTEVLLQVERGTTLEVLDEERGWFWVVIPPDAHGTRRAGWINARNVEAVPSPATLLVARLGQPDGQGLPTSASSAASAAETAVTITEDRVTITDVRDGTASAGTNAPGARKEYTFEDVHFDRDRYALRPDDVDILQAVATALKADPSLVLNIEGYACSLGTPAHNLALGSRRANAVKDYLVSEGIAVQRLHTTSFGEDHPKHDNSREETRRLNRRVAVVPNVQP